MDKKAIKGLGEVWCASCLDKDPSFLRRAHYMIPVRTNPYDLAKDGFNIDDRLIGICKECISDKNEFQQKDPVIADINHPCLVTSYIES